MLSSVEPRITPFPTTNMKKEEEEDEEEAGLSVSPKYISSNSSSSVSTSSATNSNPIEEHPTSNASSLLAATMKFNAEAAASTFSQFSAAKLFGLFENSFEQPNHNITPQEVKKTENNNIGLGAALGNFNLPFFFGNNANMLPLATVGGTTMPTAATTPIDQLLQISQQISTDSKKRPQMNNQSTGEEEAEEEQQQLQQPTITTMAQMRSYPYTFQFCVLCQKNVHSSKLPCHIRQCHVGKPMFQCPVCDFTSTYSKNNVKSHMVSLHGLAGDPISYMDQYAAQVEDFMKKCFPNVRGRGRPVHGRFSPNAKHLLMSPTNTIVSTGSNVSAESVSSSIVNAIQLTPPTTIITSNSNHQQRRHSAQALFSTPPNNSRNGVHHQQQRPGRQRNSQRAAAVNNLGVDERMTNENALAAAAALQHHLTSFGDQRNSIGSPGEFYEKTAAAMGMFGAASGAGMILPKSGGGPNEQQLNIMEKLALPNGFPAVPAFNPFLYLQQLNLFPAGTFHPNGGSTLDVKNMQMRGNNGDQQKVEDREMAAAGDCLLTESAGSTLLEECLNLSKKFLSEMNGKEEQPGDEEEEDIQMEEEQEEANGNGGNGAQTATLVACHSSSSTNTTPTSRSSAMPISINISSASAATSSANIHCIDSNVAARTDEPRYFPQPFKWTVLDGPSLDNTVFNTFSTNSELIEKFDLSIFESLLEQNFASGGSLLTAAQRERIAQVRAQLDNLQSFEIMFALHRLDNTVLKPHQLRLVEQIAPIPVDCRRFALFEQQNATTLLDKDEQFVLELSKIERLKERLAIMMMMGGEFDGKMAKLNQQIQSLCSAAKLLSNSAQFHTLLLLLLTSINLIGGDFTGQLVKGFHPIRILDMCAFRFPSGATLLDVLAQIVRKHFPELVVFIGQSAKVAEEAAKVEFSQILWELHDLQKGQAMLEEELHMAGGDAKNPQLANFLAHYIRECAQFTESVQNAKNQLVATLEFFGESGGNEECSHSAHHHQFKPEGFLTVIAKFLKNLQNTL